MSRPNALGMYADQYRRWLRLMGSMPKGFAIKRVERPNKRGERNEFTLIGPGGQVLAVAHRLDTIQSALDEVTKDWS